jgi:hypothetical protein
MPPTFSANAAPKDPRDSLSANQRLRLLQERRFLFLNTWRESCGNFIGDQIECVWRGGGKWQMNLYDPDGTRIEFMEFTPVQKPCGSEYTAPHPKP